MLRAALLAGLALWLAAAPRRAVAQAAPALVGQGIRAYQLLELDEAAALLRGALAASGSQALGTPERLRALAYLFATELLRERGDSATAAARRLLQLDPRYRVNALIFPPEVVSAFDEVRERTKVVVVRAPPVARFRPGTEGLPFTVYASSAHDVHAAVVREDGTVHRVLYSGAIIDSLELAWDGLDGRGEPPAPGRYALALASHDGRGRAQRVLRLPLQVDAVSDSQPEGSVPERPVFVPPPQEPLSRRSFSALAGGTLIGAAVALLPSLLASGEDLGASSFLVGGAVALGGLVSFVAGRRHDEEGTPPLIPAPAPPALRPRLLLTVRVGEPTVLAVER
jgi:hypothetical protein